MHNPVRIGVSTILTGNSLGLLYGLGYLLLSRRIPIEVILFITMIMTSDASACALLTSGIIPIRAPFPPGEFQDVLEVIADDTSFHSALSRLSYEEIVLIGARLAFQRQINPISYGPQSRI